MTKKFLFLLIVIAGLIEFGCKKTSSGPPMISSVRLIDSTKRDSTFMQAIPGTEIVIQGDNLGGAQEILFNDTAAFFNPVYNTSTHIIVTIPSSSQTIATNPKVPNKIKVVTDHGTATYNFQLYLPPPYISSIALDNTGTMVTINGDNFEGAYKITFPVPGNDTALSFVVNNTYTQITAAIPPGVAFNDSLRVFCTFGVGAISYPPPMKIYSVSNENAVAGTTILLTGSNFIGIGQVIFPGGIAVSNFQPISVTQMSVTVPAGITSTDSLRLSGVLGSAVSPQLFDSYLTHPSTGYLCTFENQNGTDNQGFVGWTGGYATAGTATTSYPGGTGATGVLLQGSPMSPNAGPTSQGNPGLLQLSDLPWVANTGASVSNYSLKFEVYVASPWSKGEIWISVGDWYTWSSFSARYAPWSTAAGGIYAPTGWVTVTIPLSQFISGNQFWQTAWNTSGPPANHFTDYPTTGIGFLIANDQGSAVPANSVNLAIDNIRIVQGQ